MPLLCSKGTTPGIAGQLFAALSFHKNCWCSRSGTPLLNARCQALKAAGHDLIAKKHFQP